MAERIVVAWAKWNEGGLRTINVLITFGYKNRKISLGI